MNVHGSAVSEPDNREEGPPPIMPHLSCSATMLDQLFPRVEAPMEELLYDVLDDRRDGVYQHGLQLAGKILKQSHAEGRRRRPEEPTTTATASPTTTASTSSAPSRTTTTAPAAPARSTTGTRGARPEPLNALSGGAFHWPLGSRRSAWLRGSFPGTDRDSKTTPTKGTHRTRPQVCLSFAEPFPLKRSLARLPST